jgi:DNA-binding transcriptional LysR family regulator
MVANLTNVDLRLLRVFSTIVECGGYSAAQVALNIGQSTISSHMTDLEARLGTRLCERGRGGFRLTPDGRAVYEAVQRLFRSLDAFTSEVEATRGRLVGELHIGTVDNVITNVDCRLYDAIARFKRRDSSVHLTLHVGTPSEIERAVVEGRHQIGIGGYTKRAPGIEYLELFREEQRLYCGENHPLFAGPDAGLEVGELRRWEQVKRGYVPDSQVPLPAGPKATATAFNMETIAQLILSGHFIGFLPTHYAAHWVERGAMRAIRPETLRYYSQYELIVRKNRPRQSAAEVFIDDLITTFGAASKSAAE